MYMETIVDDTKVMMHGAVKHVSTCRYRAWYPMLKCAKDRHTGDVTDKYPPTIKLTLPYKNDEFQCLVYDDKKELIDNVLEPQVRRPAAPHRGMDLRTHACTANSCSQRRSLSTPLAQVDLNTCMHTLPAHARASPSAPLKWNMHLHSVGRSAGGHCPTAGTWHPLSCQTHT